MQKDRRTYCSNALVSSPTITPVFLFNTSCAPGMIAVFVCVVVEFLSCDCQFQDSEKEVRL
jgi:hypothetical protein